MSTSVIYAFVASFGLGRIRVTRKTKAKADQQPTEEISVNSEAVMKRRVETTKDSSTINHMHGYDVGRELRANRSRKG